MTCWLCLFVTLSTLCPVNLSVSFFFFMPLVVVRAPPINDIHIWRWGGWSGSEVLLYNLGWSGPSSCEAAPLRNVDQRALPLSWAAEDE